MKATRNIILVLALAMNFTVFALEAKNAVAEEEAAPTETEIDTSGIQPEKVDMKNLEKKYWQPSDQSYTVVQSRTYSKDKKFGISVLGGVVLLDDWSNGYNLDLAASYYLTERLGVEFQASIYSMDDNDLVGIIIDQGGLPDHGKATHFVGAFARWVPFYSKMSFMGQKVVYFDMSFGLGLGLLGYEQQLQGATATARDTEAQTAIAVAVDISQTYFINPKLAFRVDYKMKFYNEEIVRYNVTADGPKGSKIRDDFADITSLNLGLTYYF